MNYVLHQALINRYVHKKPPVVWGQEHIKKLFWLVVVVFTGVVFLLSGLTLNLSIYPNGGATAWPMHLGNVITSCAASFVVDITNSSRFY